MRPLIATAVLACLLPLAAHAAVVDIHVTSAADSGPGTLRQAIVDGNTFPASNNVPRILIDLDSSSPIVLSSVLPKLTAPSFIIQGSMAGMAVIDGNNNSRIFDVDPAVLLFSLRNLRVQNGYSTSAVSACLQMPGSANTGFATLDNTRFENCRQDSTGVTNGAAVLMQRNLTVKDSVFQFNQSQGTSATQGAAIALFGNTDLTIENSYFGSNHAVSSSGPGTSQALGGAIFVQSGKSVSISDSIFTGNNARTPNSSDPGSSRGGALYVALSNPLEISRSAFDGNDAKDGGAIYHVGSGSGSATVSLRNTTLYGNQATQGRGGAVFSNSVLILRSNTFWKNSASVAGDNLATQSAGVEIDSAFNNLFAAGTGAGDSCSGFSTTLATGYNIVPAVECGLGSGSNDLVSTALHIRGAYTGPGRDFTVRFYANSPALDAGDPTPPDDADFSACPTLDGIGQARPVNGSGTGAPARCDIGAVEEQSEVSLFVDDFEARWLRP
ncbi:MAG: choice-of-anchor Q domain-containing protein [Rhodanobacteraceae bacterium]